MIAASPIGPAPTIATVSPGTTPPLRTPTSYEVGRMSARNSACSSAISFGSLCVDVSANGTRANSAWSPLIEVAQDPPAAAHAEAVVAFLAEAAAPAGRDAGHEHAIPLLEGRHGRALLDDGPDRLVAEDRPRLDLGHVSLEDVEVRPADRGRVDPHDRVGLVDDLRVGHGIPRALTGTVKDECLHFLFLLSTIPACRARPRVTSASARVAAQGFLRTARGPAGGRALLGVAVWIRSVERDPCRCVRARSGSTCTRRRT